MFEILFLLFDEYLVISARDALRNAHRLSCKVSVCGESWNVPRNDEKSFQCEIVVRCGRTDGHVDGRKRVSASFLLVHATECDVTFAQAPFRQPRISTVCTGRDLPFVRPRSGVRWAANTRYVVLAAEFVKIQLFWDVTFVDWGFPGHQSSDALLTPLLNSCPWR